MAGTRLNDEVKTFIVQALACFDTPLTVAKAVKDEFGLEISRQLVETHDPTKRAGGDLGKKWRAIFEQARRAFLEDTSSIAISHRAVRLRALERMAQKAEQAGNMVLASQLIEQAAKEMGGSFTNRRELSGPAGAPIQIERSADEISQAIESKLASLSAKADKG